jgi:2-methylcitrate dehydratase PrpD
LPIGARPVIGLDRRQILVGTGLAVAASAAQPAFAAPAEAPTHSADPGAVTRTLAAYISAARPDALPENVRREGKRSLLNWVGVAIGGSRHPTVDIAVSAIQPFSGPAQASLFGRAERLDVMNAAFVNAVSSHIFDYDDTHLKTIIHPAGPVASAILAFAEYRSAQGQPISGRDALNALVLGIEVECRIGNAVYPEHYDVGWHITGTTGPFGAAAAIANLMRLSPQQTTYALGLAASQPVGLRESFGSMNKSFNPGRAASNGLFAAILAEKGFTSSDAMIEAKRGWAHVVSTKQDFGQIADGLGTRYEAALNTYKPFACGIVLHPIIDAAIQLRNENKLSADQIDRIDMRVNPLVLELTGKTAPRDGLESKFSVYHATAVAIIQGAGGERQFSDAAATDGAVVALRARVRPQSDVLVKAEQADVIITLKDGRILRKHVEHAIGSLERPMSDADLAHKFLGLARDIIPDRQANAVLDLCNRIEELSDISQIGISSRRTL